MGRASFVASKLEIRIGQHVFHTLVPKLDVARREKRLQGHCISHKYDQCKHPPSQNDDSFGARLKKERFYEPRLAQNNEAYLRRGPADINKGRYNAPTRVPQGFVRFMRIHPGDEPKDQAGQEVRNHNEDPQMGSKGGKDQTSNVNI